MKNKADLRFTAFQRALDLLAASGATFGAEFGGKSYGAPLLRHPNDRHSTPTPGRYHSGRTGHSRRTKHDLTEYGYRARVKAAAPGDLLMWENVPNKVAESLRSACTSAAAAFFGTGSAISSVKKTARGVSRVEVLIVSGKSTD